MEFPHLSHVEGWLMPQALTFTSYFAQRFLVDEFDSLEIGVHHGKYFLGIEKLTPVAGRCMAIDVFSRQDLNVDGSGAGDKEIFERNVMDWALAPQRVVALEVDSMDIDSRELGRNKFGIISIDGGHTREHTFHDLKTAQDLLAPNGLIILDDILNQDWCGVITGALDFFNSSYATRISPVAIGFNKLFITHFSVASTRKSQILQDRNTLAGLGISLGKSTPLGGNDVISIV
jgi:hypothetical protein